jgi:RNA polymerase sigma-70 factor, ECF subfamily
VLDESLAKALQRQQVTDLYAAERDGVFRSLIVVGLSRAKAEESTQEAFLRLYAALRNGSKIDAPRAWLYRVAHNLAVDALGYEARESDRLDAVLETAASSNGNAEKNLIREESMVNLRAAVARLSKQQRLCLELRAEGLRYQDITVVGISGEVEKWQHRKGTLRGDESLRMGFDHPRPLRGSAPAVVGGDREGSSRCKSATSPLDRLLFRRQRSRSPV